MARHAFRNVHPLGAGEPDGQGNQLVARQQTPIDVYDNLYRRFNPTKFDADKWVAAAKAAGMKYIVLTTKHHDGFCLWDTKQTDYNIMRSPFARDVVRELADACKRQGIAFGTYYSTTDWHHPDFPWTYVCDWSALEKYAKPKDRPNANLDRYEQYLRKQVEELVRNYGPLLTIWFDVPQGFDAKRGQRVVDFVRSLQPDILINNRTRRGRGLRHARTNNRQDAD